jgi:membrane-associated phospholipid phosphatase
LRHYYATMLHKTLKNNAFFLLPYLIVLTGLVPIFILYTKPEIHVWINQHNSAFFDWFFRHITFLGDGLFIIVPALILLFFSLRHVVFLLTAYFSTGLITQLLKRLFFEDAARPSKYFRELSPLHLVDGIKMLSGRSFPSGHSTTAFALFLCLALIASNRYIKLICFILACLVAFSRVYLSQHFLIDVFAGSIIGSLGTIAFYQLFYHDDRNWHTWSVQKLFKDDISA